MQYGGDNGVFALLGSHMGRYMMVLEGNQDYVTELPKIMQAQATRLNERKAIEKGQDNVPQDVEVSV